MIYLLVVLTYMETLLMFFVTILFGSLCLHGYMCNILFGYPFLCGMSNMLGMWYETFTAFYLV